MNTTLSTPLHCTDLNRRKFIINTAKSAGVLALFSMQPFLNAENVASTKNQLTVQQVIDIILKEGELSPLKETVDTIKYGEATQNVSGIVTTMFATVAVIEQAAQRNANFIIAH